MPTPCAPGETRNRHTRKCRAKIRPGRRARTPCPPEQTRNRITKKCRDKLRPGRRLKKIETPVPPTHTSVPKPSPSRSHKSLSPPRMSASTVSPSVPVNVPVEKKPVPAAMRIADRVAASRGGLRMKFDNTTVGLWENGKKFVAKGKRDWKFTIYNNNSMLLILHKPYTEVDRFDNKPAKVTYDDASKSVFIERPVTSYRFKFEDAVEYQKVKDLKLDEIYNE